jgi:uncharacterized membrane protein
MRLPKWLLLSLAVPVLWGLWGALTEIPEKWLNPSFPPTLGYIVWSLTMLPVTAIALHKIGWKMKLTRRSFLYGCAVGFSGAAGQLLLFWVLQLGPAYLIFPIVCLSPAVTIVLSWTILRERTYPLALSGILLSLPAIFLVSLQSPSSSPVHGSLWLLGAIAIFFMWGLQAYFMKSSASSIGDEELFVYMTATGLALSPVALLSRRFRNRVRTHVRHSISQRGRLPAVCVCRSTRKGDRGRPHDQRTVSNGHHHRFVAHLSRDSEPIQFRRHGPGTCCRTLYGLRRGKA